MEIEKHFNDIKKNTVYIKTDRLVLRTFEENDIEQFKELFNMPEWPAWRTILKPIAKEFFAEIISSYEEMDIVNGAVSLGIFDYASGKIIGLFTAQEHDDLHEPEFGYAILPFARGKGYAKEAALAALNWIKNNYNIPYIIGTVGVNNIASQKIMEHCGFKLVDERNLLVHAINEHYDFKYYRFYF